MTGPRLPELLIRERDQRAYELKRAGLSYRQIAKVLNISEQTAYAGFKRSVNKLNEHLVESHRDWLAIQMDRLEHMLANLWPQTMSQEIETPDGNSMKIPPNLDAIDRVLKIIDKEAKFQGIDGAVRLEVSQSHGPAVGAQQGSTGEITPEDEARQLLRVLAETGVFDTEQVKTIRHAMGESDIIDAVVVGEGTPELGPGSPEDEAEDPETE